VRPVLSPSVRRLWRDAETLQLGRPPGRASVLAGLDPPTRAVLALLDGTRDTAQVVAAAELAGCPAARTHALLDLLADAGLLHDGSADADVLRHLLPLERERLSADIASLALVHGDGGLAAVRRRGQARVTVLGGGRVGAPLAALLAGAGVGGVDVRDEAPARPQDVGVGGLRLADVGRSRGEAARELLAAGCPGVDVRVQRSPDLVVLAPSGREPLDTLTPLLAPGCPHLVAEVRDGVGVVGPLVVPGSTACLRCLDLTRTDLDPDWPALAAQLGMAVRATPPCDGPLAAAVAAQAALQALALLDGLPPASAGGTLELALPDWRWRRRSWATHPACGCSWPATG
jgi:bacteriocin biosynthesis cyclodehydratase domain-containing protein